MIERGQTVYTNFYQIQINPNSHIYRYQLSFQPFLSPEQQISKWRDIFKIAKSGLQENLKVFITNNQILYSPVRAQTMGLLLGVYEEEGTSYSISIEEKAVLKPGEPEYTGLIGRFFKMLLKQQKLLQIGRKYFNTKNLINFDQFGLKVLPGVSCSLIKQEEQGKYYINIDSSFKMLRSTTMYEELRNSRDFSQLEGAIVMTVYNYKFYKVNKVSREMNPKSEFENLKGEKMSYMQYYQDKYKIAIKDVTQPLIEVLEKSRKKQEEKIIYLIPELCVMTGLSNEMRNNFQTMKQLSTVTKPRGVDRVRQADQFIQCFHNKESEELIKKWNIQLEPKCLQIQSSKIKPGNIMMGNNTAINIETGNLDRDTQTAMLRGVGLENWGILYSDRDGRQAEDFMSCLRESIEYCKFQCKAPRTFVLHSNRIEDWIKQIDQIVQQSQGPQKVTLLLLILNGPKKNAPLYTDIKRYLINDCPIASQVILSSTLNQPKGKVKTICNKLLVQICAKVGGTPWGVSELPFTDQPTMICGMDVYHSTGKAKKSMLSFVSTEDEFFSKYMTQSIEMETGVEFSFSLCPVLVKSLQSFCGDRNGPLPSRIIIFRDGVSNSQAKTVIETEVAQFRQAIEQVKTEKNSDKPIKLIVLSVNKKVGAKFYAGERNLDNPPQGTLIDTEISNGKDDYYLISQRTTQGTVQPTHYHVLVNDMSDEPNILKKLQSLSYKLCYMYYNFSGAIKIPAPIQYAHVCSNFIGDRFDPRKPQSLIKPNPILNQRRSLFFI
ncbi:unnamed protein product (macronuclear) [Paramecium tetraurelia]|uniref:Chromosome undetermined scaffold_24, whole genome shotgun sequence n=1 Tax=Paramecium tetraurelia TaxID=5888 RepID=Q3SE54_PARTE|nr:uncharacterized protein GSPATT00009468001 [Paramecium tetraurelia]CAI39070.1 PAZ and PIWI domain protein [Paramecium tetraurelia]CAK73120.1 unnamed protein product [Paramecium tetraurelia]|eukprot:XP_001440517.1 hypothetical protein (macronuclear) [Paramecium tetraurelia strain d4-2]